MRKTLLLCILLQLTAIVCPAQLKLIERTLTELHITNNSIGQIVRQPDGKLVALAYLSSGRIYQTALMRFDSTGKLDSSFGKNGIDTFTTNNLAPYYEGAYLTALALQGDKILVGGGAYFYSSYSQGNTLMARFTSSGRLDSTFGKNGVAISNVFSGSGISIDEISSIAVDGANRIAFTGRTYDYAKYRFLVGRYTPDGQLDYTFGGGGLSVFDIGTKDDEALDIKVRSGNRLLILGKTYESGQRFDVALLALKANGERDSSFGKNGIKVSVIGPGSDVAVKMAIQPDNKIVCAGNSDNNVHVLRFKSNGNADSSFGQYGKVVLNTGSPLCTVNSLLLQSGGIVVSGYAMKDSINNFFALRLKPKGQPDSSFAHNGYLYKKIYGVGDNAYAACLLPGDKFIQAGQANRNVATLFALVLYTADGTVDNSFANNGVKTFALGASRDVAFNMVQLPWDNSLLLCGTANNNWCLVKYKANKSVQVDKAFAVNGVATVPYAYYGDQFAEPDVAVDSANKKIYMSGQVGNDVLIFKYNANGTPDTAFGKKGLVKYPGIYIYYDGLGVLPNGNVVFCALSHNNGVIVAMLKPDGSTETSFGTQGEVRQIPMNAFDLYVDKSTNTIKVGGTVVYNQAYYQAMCVYSLKFNGKVDAAYGQNGLARLIKPDVSANLYKYRMTADNFGRILISGGVQYLGYEAGICRFTKDGQPDKTFGDNGMIITSITNNMQTNPVNEGIAAAGVSPAQGFVVSGGTAMDSYFKTASPAIVSYKSDGSQDSISHDISWDKSVFKGNWQAVYALLMDSVKPNGYTLYVAGTGGAEGNLDFGLAKYERYYTVKGPVDGHNTGDSTLWAMYPNPAQSQVTVTCAMLNFGKVSIKLLTMQGKLLKQYTFTNAGKNWFTQTIQLPAGLAAGTYIVQVSDGVHGYSGKLIKQ